MAELDTTYRTPRHRSGMDPNTRKLALIAGAIGAVLVVMVGAWSLTGGKSGGVPVVEADSRPLRVKPDKTQHGPDIDEPTTPGKQALAPTPEAPRPEALRAQAEKAAAEKLAAEKAQAETIRLASAPAAPPVQSVALTSPTAPTPTPTPAPVLGPLPAAPMAQAARPPTPPVAPAVRSSTSPPALPTAAAGTQVQLAAVTTEQAALSEWNRLERRMPEVLGGRRPAVVRAERDGKTFWRLRTGGFTDTTQASSFCEQVRAKGGTCSVASF